MFKTILTLFVALGLGLMAALSGGLNGSFAQPANNNPRLQDDDDGDQDDDEDEGDEEGSVDLDKLPDAARAAIKKAAGANEIVGVDAESVLGTTLYEAAWMVGDVEHEVLVASDGTVLEMEEVIAMEDAPAGVQAAAAKGFPEGAEIVVEKKMVVVYSLEAMIGDKEREIQVTGTGHRVEIEVGDDDEGIDGDDDNDDDDGDDEDGDDDHDHDHDDDGDDDGDGV